MSAHYIEVNPPAAETVSDIANRLVNAYEWPFNERREFRSDELAELLEHAALVALGIETI